jgi:hypothetical protein
MTDWLLAAIGVALFLIWSELRALRANLFTYVKRVAPGDWHDHLKIP